MFSPGSPDEIPWQDGFFNRVVEMGGVEYSSLVCREIARVLTGGGEAWLSHPPESEDLVRAGLSRLESVAEFQRFAKPEPPAPRRSPGSLPVMQ